ncbi:40S ribosomal protein S19-1 [Vitis vinifera]|uniref:40S ribosomal protein S19-1 n=1 Tax=Vitis vinifera TaxID=29760 RepID=A0A438J0W8_VITVI|nr:40S ribosomal protein S19-1 [Vitis vinifera]
METAKAARTVKDVSPHEFVKAYSSHLKRSGKVPFIASLLGRSTLCPAGANPPLKFGKKSMLRPSRISSENTLDSLKFTSRSVLSPQIELPHWTDIVKTATFKELAPYDPDWYYVRAASMARKIYLRQGLGVGGFRRIYGGSKRNGSRPPHFCKSSGSIARHILQQLEKMNIIENDPRG